jgi:hypothetical protein
LKGTALRCLSFSVEDEIDHDQHYGRYAENPGEKVFPHDESSSLQQADSVRDGGGARIDIPHVLQPVERNFQIALAVAFGLGKAPGSDVDLNRGQNEPGHVETRVPALAHFHELVFAYAIMYVDVVTSLFADCGEPRM